jgi:hypothetical protein
MVMNMSRAMWHVSVAKLPVRAEDIEKIPAITGDKSRADVQSKNRCPLLLSLATRNFTRRAHNLLQYQKHGMLTAVESSFRNEKL